MKAKEQNSASDEAKPPSLTSNSNAQQGEIGNKTKAEVVKDISGDLEITEDDNGKTIRNTHAAKKHYRRYLLIKEIKRVVLHMDASPLRQYTFAKWTWFLILLGVDETNSQKHRRPLDLKASKIKIASLSKEQKDKATRVEPFSWVGSRSPLIDKKSANRYNRRIQMGSLASYGKHRE